MNSVFVLCVIASVAYLASRIYKETKNKAKMKEYDLTKYEVTTFYKPVIIALVILVILSAYVLVWGLQNKSEVHSSIGVVMLFSGIAEIYYAYNEMRLYHNDKFCILNTKRISYNHIKKVNPKSILFITKGEVELFSGERINVYRNAADIIREKLENKR